MNQIFSNVSKIFKYNWSQLFKVLVPNGKKQVIQEDSYKTINMGSIVRIVGVFLYNLLVLLIAAYILAKATKYVLGDTSIFGYALKSLFSAKNVGELLWDTLWGSIVPIAILVYNIIMKNKEQTGWFFFIALIVSLINIVFNIFSLIVSLFTFFAAPLLAIFVVAAFGLEFLGTVSIAVGCIDFLQTFPRDPNTQTGNVGSYQPNQNPYQNNQMNNNMNMNGGYQPNPNNMNAGYQPNPNPYQNNQMNNGMYGQMNNGPMNAGMSGSMDQNNMQNPNNNNM